MAKWIAYWTLILISGAVFLSIDIAVEQVSPFELVVVRTAIASGCLFALVRIRRIPVHLTPQNLRAFVIIGLFNISIPISLIAWAQSQSVDSGLVGVLAATNPLFTLVIAHFVFADERISTPKVAGLVLGFIGTVILASRNWQDGQIRMDGLLGQGAIILAAFMFASMSVYGRKVMQSNVPPLVIAMMSAFVALIASSALAIVSYLFGQPVVNIPALETETVIALLVLGILNSFVAFSLSYFVLSQLGATRASTMTYITPIFSLTLGALFRGELIDDRVILGTGVILAGIAAVNIGEQIIKRRRRRRALIPAADAAV